MRVYNKKVSINVVNALKYPNEMEECFALGTVNKIAQDKLQKLLNVDGVEDDVEEGKTNLDERMLCDNHKLVPKK